MSQNITKSTAYIISDLGGDFQQDDYLYKSTNDIYRHPNIFEDLTGLRDSLSKDWLVNF